MGYILEAEYKTIYGDIESADFLRFSLKAERIMRDCTTGIDGFEKLVDAAPAEPSAVAALKMCAGDLIHNMSMIADAERAGSIVRRSDGTTVPAVVSSVSSGSESITYSVGSVSTATNAAVSDTKARRNLFGGIVRDWLNGVKDANGVNLLFMGAYRHV